MTDNAKIIKGRQIVLLGNYRPAQVAARKLAQLGYQVILGLGGGEGGVEYSKFVSHCWDHSCPQKNPDVFLDELNRLIENHRAIETILPTSEEFAVFLAHHSHELCRDVTIASPTSEIIETFWDKLRAFDLAKRLGVPSLPYALSDSYEKFTKQATKIGFPLIVRPVGITARLGLKKAVIVDDATALRELFPNWPKGHKQLLIQGLATGTRHNIYFAAYEGVLVGGVESQIARTDHPDGTGLATDGKTVSATKSLVEDTKALIKATNYTGIGLTQFIVDDETGERCFLELNPRISGSHAVPEAAGLALTELAVVMANGRYEPTTKQAPTKIGMRYGWTYGDIRGLKAAISERQIGAMQAIIWAFKMVGTAFAAKVQLSGSFLDPRPELVLFARQIPGLRRLVDFNANQKNPKILKEKTL